MNRWRWLAGLVLVASACGGSSSGGDAAATDVSAEPTAGVPTSGSGQVPSAVATSDEERPFTVSLTGGSASDGDVSISVPTSALPEGVSPSDLKIEDISPDALAVSIEDPNAASAYSLLPDGLEFGSPVTVTIRFPSDRPSDQFTIMHLSGEAAESRVEVITELVTELDQTTGDLTATFDLSHFSRLQIYHRKVFDVSEIDSPAAAFVGETFDVTLQVMRVVDPTSLLYIAGDAGPGAVYWKLADAPWTLEGSLEASGPVTPFQVNDRPSATGVTGETFTISESFTCLRPGAASVTYKGTVQFDTDVSVDLEGRGLFDADPERLTHEVRLAIGPVECLMNPIVAVLMAPTTTYSVDVPADSDLGFVWSGADCGSVTGSDTNTMVWNHGEEDCEHAGEAHPETQISVLVVGRSVEVRCIYQGAGSGTGPACETEQ